MVSAFTAVFLNAAQSVLNRVPLAGLSSPVMATHKIRCTSSVCAGNGNHLRPITVHYQRGRRRWHRMPCPYCKRELHFQLHAISIEAVDPEAIS